MTFRPSRLAHVWDELGRIDGGHHLHVGCSPVEVERLASMFPGEGPLPAAFEEFLQLIGKRAGWMYPGDSFFYAGLVVGLRNPWWEEGTAGNGWPTDAIVVCEWLGDNLQFIERSGGPNPPVFGWDDDRGPFEACPSYTEWLEGLVDEYASYRPSMVGRPWPSLDP